MFKETRQLYVARGKRSAHFDLSKEIPDKETISKTILGRTGNLRAPIIRKGKKMVVGFGEDIYKDILKI